MSQLLSDNRGRQLWIPTGCALVSTHHILTSGDDEMHLNILTNCAESSKSCLQHEQISTIYSPTTRIHIYFIYFQKCWILQNPFKATEITAFWTSILWLKLGDWSSSTQSAGRAAHVKLHQFDHACAPLATFGQSDPWPPVTTIFPQDRPPTFRLYPPESKVRPLPTMPTFRLTSPPVQCHEKRKKDGWPHSTSMKICESDSKHPPVMDPFTPGE